ncbi:hypothetical protein [Mycobacterium sp.]|uniref:hypothetical protein n=1 Tax=Mycobacterium sp. TaxID=1785 RepID=UPI003C770EBB
MRRRASRLVIGWLGGTGVVFGLMFVARLVPWPVVVPWWSAMWFAPRRTWRGWTIGFAEVEHAIGDVDAKQQARQAAEGDESVYEPLFQAELRFRKLEGATNILASYQFQDPGRPPVAHMDLAHMVRSGPAAPGHQARRQRQPVRHLAVAGHDVVDVDPG